MKKLKLLISATIIILTTGCQNNSIQTETKNETITTNNTTIQSQASKTETKLYKATWFDIKYPSEFTPTPPEPTNNDTQETTEVYFTSPDQTVEFFVFSPLWSGNPEKYLEIAPNEELIDEKTEEIKAENQPNQFGDKILYNATIKAKDGSYYRSLESIREQVNTGSDLHRVFGIKYKDNKSYEQHKQAYISFKNSLQQYAD